MIALLGAAGCSGSTPKRTGTDGAVTDAGPDAAEASPDAADDPPMETPADLATDTTADLAADAETGDLVADGAGDAPPPIDAGAGCVAPTGETPLDATAEGLPATGLVLWLRGDRGVYKTAANEVCAWADQSANHQLLTDTNVNARPTWSATGLGGQAAIHSTVAGDGLATGGVLGLAPTSARTLIAVVALVAPARRFHAIFMGQANTPGTYLGLDANTFNTAGSREGVYMMNNAYDAALATSTAARVHVYTIATMTPATPVLAGIHYRVNGAEQTLARTAGGFGNGNFEDFTNANFTSVATGAEAVVAEVLVYGRALTAEEQTAVETALKTRYTIP